MIRFIRLAIATILYCGIVWVCWLLGGVQGWADLICPLDDD